MHEVSAGVADTTSALGVRENMSKQARFLNARMMGSPEAVFHLFGDVTSMKYLYKYCHKPTQQTGMRVHPLKRKRTAAASD